MMSMIFKSYLQKLAVFITLKYGDFKTTYIEYVEAGTVKTQYAQKTEGINITISITICF